MISSVGLLVGEVFLNYQSATCLYILACVVDVLQNCSFLAAMCESVEWGGVEWGVEIY